MKKILTVLFALSSLSAFAGADCITSSGVSIKTGRLTNGSFGHFIETSKGAVVESTLTNGSEIVSYESKDGKTISMSFSRRTGLGTAEVEGELLVIKCKR